MYFNSIGIISTDKYLRGFSFVRFSVDKSSEREFLYVVSY